jgi:hypothetical protein
MCKEIVHDEVFVPRLSEFWGRRIVLGLGRPRRVIWGLYLEVRVWLLTRWNFTRIDWTRRSRAPHPLARSVDLDVLRVERVFGGQRERR